MKKTIHELAGEYADKMTVKEGYWKPEWQTYYNHFLANPIPAKQTPEEAAIQWVDNNVGDNQYYNYFTNAFEAGVQWAKNNSNDTECGQGGKCPYKY